MNLKEYRFDQVTINYDRQRVPLSGAERSKRKGSFPYYGAQGIIDYVDSFIFDGDYLLIAEDGENLKSKKQNIAQMAKGKFWVNNHAHIIQGNELCNTQYLCYLINSMDITGFITGSAQPKLSQANLNAIRVVLPDIKHQNKIIEILQSIDKKIETNNKINDNLFQQILLLFDDSYDISAGNEVELKTLCDFKEGYVNPAQTHHEYFDGEVKWLRAVDINESFIIDTSRTLTREGYESAKKSAFMFSPNTIAISKSGTIGRLGIIADYMCGNRAVINIAPKDPSMLPFIYAYLKRRQTEFPNLAVGSVQKNLYVSLLEPLKVSIPNTDALLTFCNAGNAMLNTISNNCHEIMRLNIIRDTILPKLMSGELDVSDIDI